jgi:hypothetical protein
MYQGEKYSMAVDVTQTVLAMKMAFAKGMSSFEEYIAFMSVMYTSHYTYIE